MQIKKKVNKIKNYISTSSRIFITTHTHIDLDSIASMIATYYICKTRWKKCFIVIDETIIDHEDCIDKIIDEFKDKIEFINTSEINKNKHKVDSKNMLFVLDTSSRDTIQNPTILDKFKKIVVLDHSVKKDDTINSKIEVIDRSASSTSEMITQLLEQLEKDVDARVATLLLAGISSDTDNFILRTSQDTYYSAYYLSCLGANSNEVQSLQKQDIKKFVNREKLLAQVEILNDGKVAYTKGSNHTIYSSEDLAKVAYTMLYFNKVEVSFVLAKIAKNTPVLYIRSLGNVDLNNLLEEYGIENDKYKAKIIFEKSTIGKQEAKLRKLIKEI